ncbi:MAG: fumarylacetoacetate hydrolase family protein [Prevotella sp.]|nr:fumarylacetoacetate hydrolase family protein [Prevotella sp.]
MKIFGVGMNYLPHNKELESALSQHGVDGEAARQPVIFTKADSALLKDGKPFFVPDFMGRIDYETELVVRVCRLGKGIAERFANRYYDAVTVGIDFTARDMQQRLRADGLPWDVCKGFDGSAVVGEWVEKDLLRDIHTLTFRGEVNGHVVQQACAADMIFGIDRLVSYISTFFTLKTGDIIFTGTPAGVGPVAVGDHITGFVEERKVLDFCVR